MNEIDDYCNLRFYKKEGNKYIFKNTKLNNKIDQNEIIISKLNKSSFVISKV